jgi:hypothetical protein
VGAGCRAVFHGSGSSSAIRALGSGPNGRRYRSTSSFWSSSRNLSLETSGALTTARETHKSLCAWTGWN